MVGRQYVTLIIFAYHDTNEQVDLVILKSKTSLITFLKLYFSKAKYRCFLPCS